MTQNQPQHNQQHQQRRRQPNFGVMMRKFWRDVQQSRILSEVKQKRYRTKPISRTERRHAAIRAAYVKRLKRGY